MQQFQSFIIAITCFLGLCLVFFQVVVVNPSTNGLILTSKKYRHESQNEITNFDDADKFLRRMMKHQRQQNHVNFSKVKWKKDWPYLRLKVNSSSSQTRFHDLIGSFNLLDLLPVINESNPISYVLILSYFRSGSSFVGDLLQQNWKTFYSFEPLHYMRTEKRIEKPREAEALELLNNLYNCQFSKANKYISWAKKEENGFLFHWNHFLWGLCSTQKERCFEPQFLSDVCKRSPYRVVKTTRLSLEAVEELIPRLDKKVNLKIVYLVRDPRAILNSRSKLDWCVKSKDGCVDATRLCGEIESDIKSYQRLVKLYGQNVLIVRHEDLSLRPTTSAEVLFTRVGLPFTGRPERFVRVNTGAHLKPNISVNPYSIKRDSKDVIMQWTKSLNLRNISSIQKNCKKVLNQLGYKLLDLEQSLNTSSLEPEDLIESTFMLNLRTW